MFGRGFNLALRGDVITLLVCVIVSVVLMSLPETTRILVADRLALVLTSPYWKTRNFGDDVLQTGKENAWLKGRVAELELLAASSDRMQRDSDRLAGPAVAPGFEGDLLPCEVVMRRGNRFATMLKVRSLTPVQWEPWLPVISQSGYLGRLKTIINEQEAWVELMSAPEFALGVEMDRTSLLGVLRPRGNSFVVEMVGRDEDVRPGDLIITSGIAEVRDDPADEKGRQLTPRGFPVGVVKSVSSPTDKIFKEIVAEPAASFTHNVTVFVVMPLGADRPVPSAAEGGS
jgi:hypothetical protein